MPDQAKDGRPDVVTRTLIYTSNEDPDSGPAPLQASYEVACRWCPESFLSPDVRSAVRWADEHEQSLSHTHMKDALRAAGRLPRDPWAGAGFWRDV